MKHVACLVAVTALALPVVAEGQWVCRNYQYEISCAEETCTASGSHTPMEVHLSAEEMDVCAYTGCWNGRPVSVVHSGRFETYTGLGLPFSTRPKASADVVVTVDREREVATILVGGLYAHPATCVAR